MLKVFTVGRVASASQLVTDPDIEKMSMQLEVVPIGWHKGREGNDHQAVVPVQLDDYQTRRYLRMGFVGCRIALDGEMKQTSAYPAVLWSKPGRWTICPTANPRHPQMTLTKPRQWRKLRTILPRIQADAAWYKRP